MLCYAWVRLREKDIVDVDKIQGNDLPDLFARVLVSGTEYLIKRGFDRKYVNRTEMVCGIKGKIDFTGSIKRISWMDGRMSCDFDELDHNTLHNQIIKTTVEQMIRFKGLDESLKDDLARVNRYFRDISSITISKKNFNKIQINKNNQYYEFVLKVCEIIYDNILVDEQSGQTKFRDFMRDDRQMVYLFENFIRNFYKRELPDYTVKRENIGWDTVGDTKYLPVMQTDISLISEQKKIIMDTKFYEGAFTSNFGADKFRSGHLYQLFAYLMNSESKGGLNLHAEGILLYPMVFEEVDADYEIQGHNVKIRTVNLNQDWKQIHERLLEIVKL
jgi:5-methylcytosine-specific restriction enzyme subunit McrC